ncbi:dihydrofolate reductase [Limnobacter litoralis]|uniref:Dihydrofolate reductase n=1 Tax=Limnobacter litoralis TaxID=481366 RepID=A0ABQ5YMI2_9BURK|nr:dihydrofolate reductase [Limnobacter litoralis]GLR25773.1 dihydrofolate reductase [Limnobacter litoralis]
MTLKLIAAVAKNGVIGLDNKLPWHLPEDLAYFKATTMGSPVLMGRKTYESIGRPLPGRLNVVLSSQAQWVPAPAKDGTPRELIRFPEPLPMDSQTRIAVVGNMTDATNWLKMFSEVYLIGGSQLYAQALLEQRVDELLLTEIDAEFKGDAYLPPVDKTRFTESSRVHNPATADRPWSFDFVTYAKHPK